MVARKLEVGMNLGRYRLDERIGQGGMGSVWRARDEVLDRDVALKALPQTLVTDPAAGRRFEREARAMGRLQHPNVVGIYDIGTADPGSGEELPFLVMELVHGRPLNDLISNRPDLRTVLRWLEQVARALAAAHAAGIVHRDLKPSNVMVDGEDHVVVLDFGLARLTERDGEVPEDTLTAPGMVLGSCPYMAPEQALGQSVNPLSDIFSFGSVLYEAVTGERAFTGETPMRVLQAVVKGQVTPAEDLAPGLPPAVYEIIERCMARAPEQRYATAGELARDLATVIEIEASSPSAVSTMAQKAGSISASRARRARRRRLIGGVAATAVVVGALAGLFGGRTGWEPIRPYPGGWSMTEVMQVNGNFYRPEWSPNGASIAVGRTDGERGEVLIVPLADDEPRTLVEGGAQEVPGHPVFSPDSTAVTVSVLTGDSQSVRVLPAVGGPPVYEIENALNGVWLDRTTVLFTRVTDGRSSVWSADLESGEEELIVEASEEVSWWEVYPRPGGGFALLGGATDLNPGVFVCDQTGVNVTQWLAPGRKLKGVSWTPDGSSIVASIGGQLVKLGEEGVQGLLPIHQVPLRFPSFSADNRLAAVHVEATYDIISVDPNGGPPECLRCGESFMGWGSTSVSGSLLYLKRQGKDSRIFVADSDGVPRALTDIEEAASCPVVSPDALRVAYLAQVDGSAQLRVRPLDGGDPVTLAVGLENSEFVSWSPDGGSIVYAGGSPIQSWVVSAAGGPPRAISGPGGDYPSWSPDGSLIAYTIWTEESDPDQGTWLVPAAGGEARKIGDLPTRVVWDQATGDLLQLRRSEGAEMLELWRTSPDASDWSLDGRLDVGVVPPIYMEFLPLTVDRGTGRLVMNRLSVTSRLVVFDGIDIERW